MTGSERARLIEAHVDLARRAASTFHPRVRQYVELEEVVALANVGLAEAGQRFDPAAGVEFSTFAYYRIRGAIIDGVRRATQLPRRVWSRLVALRAAAEYLEQLDERDPSSGAEALAQVKDALSAIKTIYITSLEAMQEGGFDLGVEPAASPGGIDTARNARRLRNAFATLTGKERAMLTKHYWEGKDLVQAGAELGISRSRASRLHARTIAKLRDAVDAPDSLQPGQAR